MVVENAHKLGCDKFVTPQDILNGNARLNLAFVADLFNKHPALDLPSLEEIQRLKGQNASLTGILDEAENRLRQILADRQLAYELQQQEILLYRQQKLREQQQLAEQEAMLIAQQQQEELLYQQQRRLQELALQEQESKLIEEQRREARLYEEQRRRQAEQAQYQHNFLLEQQRIEEMHRRQHTTPPSGYAVSSYSASSSTRSVPVTQYTQSTVQTRTQQTPSATPTYTLAPPPSTSGSTVLLRGRRVGVFEKMGKKLDQGLKKI